MSDAFETYQRSLECLTVSDEPLWERLRGAFAAGRASVTAGPPDQRSDDDGRETPADH